MVNYIRPGLSECGMFIRGTGYVNLNEISAVICLQRRCIQEGVRLPGEWLFVISGCSVVLTNKGGEALANAYKDWREWREKQWGLSPT